MTFKSQAEIDDALRVGTVPQADIEAFHVSQAQEGLAQLAIEAEVKALFEAKEAADAARFAGQKSEKDLTAEELTALEASYTQDAPPQGQSEVQTNPEATPGNESQNVAPATTPQEAV